MASCSVQARGQLYFNFFTLRTLQTQ